MKNALHRHRRLGVVCLAVLLCGMGLGVSPSAAGAEEAKAGGAKAEEKSTAGEPASPQVPQPLALSLDVVLQPRDRVLFVGDELTQQMFYTRATAAALLLLRPQLDLRFFNGGKDGATAGTTGTWVNDVMTLADPTVVFICLGLNDVGTPPLTAEALVKFQRSLAALVDQVRQHPRVRLVILMSPPPIQSDMAEVLQPDSVNHVLGTLGEGVRGVAAKRQTGYIDLYEQLAKVYLGQLKQGGVDEPLSLGGRLPTEVGHMILASAVLKGVGVSGAQLEQIGWSPLVTREMARVRPVLALATRAPQPELAQTSRDLYLQLFRFDDQFFRLWRLAGKSRRSAPDPAQVRSQADDAWSEVRKLLAPRK